MKELTKNETKQNQSLESSLLGIDIHTINVSNKLSNKRDLLQQSVIEERVKFLNIFRGGIPNA